MLELILKIKKLRNIQWKKLIFYTYIFIPTSIFHRVRTVPFFTASAIVTLPFYGCTVRSVKLDGPVILPFTVFMFDRDSKYTKNGPLTFFSKPAQSAPD